MQIRRLAERRLRGGFDELLVLGKDDVEHAALEAGRQLDDIEEPALPITASGNSKPVTVLTLLQPESANTNAIAELDIGERFSALEK